MMNIKPHAQKYTKLSTSDLREREKEITVAFDLRESEQVEMFNSYFENPVNNMSVMLFSIFKF